VEKTMSVKKHGGIWFARCGCLSFTFCRAKPKTEWQIALYADRWLVRGTVAIVAFALSTIV
jgi:hypothetical protein